MNPYRAGGHEFENDPFKEPPFKLKTTTYREWGSDDGVSILWNPGGTDVRFRTTSSYRNELEKPALRELVAALQFAISELEDP